MKPTSAIEQARPGDTVHISLRGPHNDQELKELREEHEVRYPGIRFEFTCNDDEISASLKRAGNG